MRNPVPDPLVMLTLSASWPGLAPTSLDGLDGDTVRGVVKAARRLGTAPAVVGNLNQAGYGGLLSPSDHALADATLFANIIALDVAARALELLGGMGVVALPIKGTAALLDLWRDQPGGRAMHDVDLLLDVRDFGAVTERLVAEGWRRERGGPLADGLSPEARLLVEVGQGAQLVELHRALVFPGRHTIDTASVLARTLGEGDGCRMDPADQLVYLAVHKAMHGYLNDARDLIDAGAWLIASGAASRPPWLPEGLPQTPPLSWHAVVERARRWRATGVTWLLLTRLARLGIGVPAAPLAALAPGRVRRLALERAMPDVTLHTGFEAVKNEDRPLPAKAAVALLANDSPLREGAALGVVVARTLGDATLARLGLSERVRPWAARVSLRWLE